METACSFGLFGSTAKGNHGPTALGDLATVICSYDETAGYSSNSLSKYFSNVGGRSRLQSLVTNWLGASGNASLGGSYGENPSAPEHPSLHPSSNRPRLQQNPHFICRTCIIIFACRR
jgi:hypothetical protein